MDGVDSEHLAQGIRDRQHRAERDLAATSSLPRDVFETCDPMVEAVLADAALRVFQRHMGREEHAELATPMAVLPEAERIPSQELRECAEQLASLPDEGPPDLEQGLRGERMWILLDMSKHAAGVARQRATYELRTLLARSDVAEELGVDVLRRLVPVLAEAKRQKGIPVIFHALHLAAERALRAQEAAT